MTRKELIAKIQSDSPFISNQELVYEVVLSDLLSHTLKGGEKISQGKLGSEFNLSRGPIKIALERLEKEGFLVRNEDGSFFVREADPYFMGNIYTFKRQLDLLATSQAIYDISKEKLDLLHKNVADMCEALQSHDYLRFQECDMEFHLIIVDVAHNPLLKETYQRYQNLFRFVALSNTVDEHLLRRLLHQHQRIYMAIKSRNPETAQAAVDAHYSSLMLF